MYLALLGTVFLKHKLSQADPNIMCCYFSYAVLMAEISDGHNLEGFHYSLRIFQQVFFVFIPNEKLVKK